MRQTKYKKRKGFTLAELLIVVAIIAVLVAIAIPIFSGQLEKSRHAVDLDHGRKIKSAIWNSLNNGNLDLGANGQICIIMMKNKLDGAIVGASENGTTSVVYKGEIASKDTQWNSTAKVLKDILTDQGINYEAMYLKQKKKNWYAVFVDLNTGNTGYVDGTEKTVGDAWNKLKNMNQSGWSSQF